MRKRISVKPRADTDFIQKWGVGVNEVAEREGVSTVAIYMRVMNYKTPFQRKNGPSEFEKKYAKTTIELAEELNCHPASIYSLESKGRDLFGPVVGNPGIPRGSKVAGHPNWREHHKYQQKCWLMEEHPQYQEYREGKMFPDEYVGGGMSWDELKKVIENNKLGD